MTHGAYILGCAGPVLTEVEAAFFREADPWGFILFARNIGTPDQVHALTDALRGSVGRDAPILVDQEGGRVARLAPPRWRGWLPPLDEADRAGPARAPRSLFLRHRLIAQELRAVGIDVNCAPLGDVARDATHPFLRNRCLGTRAETVASLARAAADGLLAGGALPVIKHLPGHGRARADSHLALPRVTAPRADLEAVDFAPFRALSDLPMAMTAHVVFDALDPGHPATLSPACIAAIREVIGFGGLLMTDDISMGALAGPVGARAQAALAAGCDVVLHCNGDAGEMAEIVAACGRMAPAAADRAARAIAARPRLDAAAPDALAAEHAALLGEAAHG